MASVLSVSAVVIAFLIGFVIVRGRRIEQQEAIAALQDVERALPEIRSLLAIPIVDSSTVQAGIAKANHIVNAYSIASPDWKSNSLHASLSDSNQLVLSRCLAEVSNLSATAKQRLGAPDAIEAATIAKRLNEGVLLDEHSRHGLFHKAAEHLRHFEFEKAIPVLEELRSADPYDTSTWLLLGNANAAISRHSVAEHCYTVCIEMWPDSYLGHFYRGLSQLDAKQFEDAAADFGAVLDTKPNFVPAYINRGIALQQMNQFDGAIADFDAAIAHGATQTRIYFLRSQARASVGDKEGAEADYQRGVQETPTDEKSWIRRGLELLKTDPAAAMSDFQSALGLNPTSRVALRNVAHILSEVQHRNEDALAVLDKLVNLHGRQPDDLVSRAVLLARLGRRGDAVLDAHAVLGGEASAKQLFQVACVYSLTSQASAPDVDVALSVLDQAIGKDIRWMTTALSDEDLGPIRESADFRRIMVSAKQRWERGQRAKKALNKTSKPYEP
ncbi:MAG: tetratricopeptide repeat protein [Planctomycetales bacterium]|nr:tetratricopeptide repeat protein [Planctomycetales bacterium]